MKLHSTPVPESPCPYCGQPNDAASDVRNRAISPQPGNACLCFTCGHLLVYTEQLRTRRPTADELANLLTDPGIRHALDTWQRFQAWRASP